MTERAEIMVVARGAKKTGNTKCEINILQNRKVDEVEMNLANFRYDENGNQYGLKRCKYHCDYGDGEYCHYKEHDGCIYNKSQDEQIKGRRMSDAESMGLLFDNPQDMEVANGGAWFCADGERREQ